MELERKIRELTERALLLRWKHIRFHNTVGEILNMWGGFMGNCDRQKIVYFRRKEDPETFIRFVDGKPSGVVEPMIKEGKSRDSECSHFAVDPEYGVVIGCANPDTGHVYTLLQRVDVDCRPVYERVFKMFEEEYNRLRELSDEINKELDFHVVCEGGVAVGNDGSRWGFWDFSVVGEKLRYVREIAERIHPHARVITPQLLFARASEVVNCRNAPSFTVCDYYCVLSMI